MGLVLIVVHRNETIRIAADRTTPCAHAIRLRDGIDAIASDDGKSSDILMAGARDPIDRKRAVALARDDQVFLFSILQEREPFDVRPDSMVVDARHCERLAARLWMKIEAPHADVFFADVQMSCVVVDGAPLRLRSELQRPNDGTNRALRRCVDAHLLEHAVLIADDGVDSIAHSSEAEAVRLAD